MSSILEVIEPMGARFLVACAPEQEELSGKIIAPEASRLASQMGTIVKAGPDCGGDVAVGRVIVYSRYSGMDFAIEGEIGGRKVKMMEPIDILGYLPEGHEL